MAIKNDTQFVMKNGVAIQPDIPHDGLELYYDVKGKKNTDNYKSTLLDMSGKGRHGTLSNFAYEGVSGFTGTPEGGLLLDDVDDKIVRPAISGIEYTSASRNVFSTVVGEWELGTVDATGAKVANNTRVRLINLELVEANVDYVVSVTTGYLISGRVNNVTNAVWAQSFAFNSTDGNVLLVVKKVDESVLTTEMAIKALIQLEKGSTATPYTPYIPLPIMTYQMNGNILSFEKDGTVKRTTKDANGNEVVVSRKGINLVRNGNFALGLSQFFSGNNGRWIGNGSYARYNIEDNYLRLNGGGLYINPLITYQSTTLLCPNKKVYFSIWYRSNNVGKSKPTKAVVELKDSFNANILIIASQNITDSDWHRVEGVGVNVSYDSYLSLRVYFNGFNDKLENIGYSWDIKEAQMIDLTEAYGAGNEPTLAYIQAHSEEFAWTPNPNDLIETVEIKNNLVGDIENLQGNDFEQHEDGVITYTNEAEEGSVVRVDIDGLSDQPLRFRNATGEQVVITQHDQIDADAIKKVEFAGNSVQLADKYREVSGTSVTIAPELHDKTVADKLVIGGNTTQYTETSNVVTDGLQMWLSGRNFSNNPATTTWKDLTGVNNGTASGFEYRTNVYADVVSDFTGKIAGSVVENANIAKWASTSSTLLNPIGTWSGELGAPSYAKIYSLDNGGEVSSRSTPGYIAQNLFSFNVIKAFEKKHGNIPSTDQTTTGKVAWLKDNLSNISAKWHGYGSNPTGNKAYLIGYRGSWLYPTSHSSATISNLTLNYVTGEPINSLIQSDGFVHIMAYTDASDGVTASTIVTDYISLTLISSGASGSDGAGGVNFDGVDDVITTSEISIPKYQGWTYDTVMSFNDARWADFAGIGSYSGGSLIHHSVAGLGVYQDYYNSGTYLFSSNLMAGTAFPLKTPTRITISYTPIANENKGTFTFYINGVKRATLANQTLSPNPSLTAFKFKYVGSASARYLNGNIKTVLLYNRTLSDAEILQNYNAGLAIPIPNIAMPQEVKHVNSGSKVLVHGKNLIKETMFTSPSDLTTVSYPKLGSVQVSGTTYQYSRACADIYLEANKTYYFKCYATKSVSTGSSAINIYTNINGANTMIYSAMLSQTTDKQLIQLSFTTTVSGTYGIWLYSNYGTPAPIIECLYEDIIFSTENVVYEPYKQTETTIPVTLRSIG